MFIFKKFILKATCNKKLTLLENCLDSKIDWMHKLLVLKNYLDSKIDWMEKLLILKNRLNSKIDWMENLLVLKTIWIKKLFVSKN
jgi:hypothetical protein